MRIGSVLLVAVAASVPTAAVAEPTDFDPALAIGGLSIAGEQAASWSGGVDVRTGFEVRHGVWSIAALFDFASIDTTDAMRDGTELSALGAAVDLRLFPHRGRWEPYILVGAHAHAIVGDDNVVRTCHQTGTCLAGFYSETPGYAEHAIEIGAGIQLAGRAYDANGALRVELVYARPTIELPGDGATPGSWLVLAVGGVFGPSTGR